MPKITVVTRDNIRTLRIGQLPPKKSIVISASDVRKVAKSPTCASITADQSLLNAAKERKAFDNNLGTYAKTRRLSSAEPKTWRFWAPRARKIKLSSCKSPATNRRARWWNQAFERAHSICQMCYYPRFASRRKAINCQAAQDGRATPGRDGTFF